MSTGPCFTPTRSALLACSVAALAALGACAARQTAPAPLLAGRAQLVLPPGEWQDLGLSDQALTLLPEVGATLPLQTRTVGLRGPGDTWLALLRVQTNRTGQQMHWETRWTDTCPQQKDMLVEDATAVTTAKGTLTSHVRVDCLRFKRFANNEGWMEQSQPVMAQWLSQHNAAPSLPYSHLHYRYATQGGAYVDIQAVVDQRLLRPPTHNNHEFLAAGRPGQAWVHALALAGRQSTALLDGMLAIPPFPIALSH